VPFAYGFVFVKADETEVAILAVVDVDLDFASVEVADDVRCLFDTVSVFPTSSMESRIWSKRFRRRLCPSLRSPCS
jgi:hypothetical protein